MMRHRAPPVDIGRAGSRILRSAPSASSPASTDRIAAGAIAHAALALGADRARVTRAVQTCTSTVDIALVAIEHTVITARHPAGAVVTRRHLTVGRDPTDLS